MCSIAQGPWITTNGNAAAIYAHANDLVNARLKIKPDYVHATADGEVWLQLRPHLAPTDSAEIDAKKMDIHQVCIEENSNRSPLPFTYDYHVQSDEFTKKFSPKPEDFSETSKYIAAQKWFVDTLQRNVNFLLDRLESVMNTPHRRPKEVSDSLLRIDTSVR